MTYVRSLKETFMIEITILRGASKYFVSARTIKNNDARKWNKKFRGKLQIGVKNSDSLLFFTSTSFFDLHFADLLAQLLGKKKGF